MPFPGPFVVKKGSKIRALTSGDMPHPVSDTVNATHRCGVGNTPGLCSPTGAIALAVVIRRVPPRGIASRALIARFMRT